jgi:hypothetical protein
MRLAAYFGRCLADYALKKGADAAEARRDRAEADLLGATRRHVGRYATIRDIQKIQNSSRPMSSG